MFTYMIKRHLDRGGRALVFTHRKELLKQAGSTFEKFDLEPELITAGSHSDLSKPLHVSMIETFDRRKENYSIFLKQKTLIVIDEAHLNSFTKVFDYISKDTTVIGATATPYRKGKGIPELKEFYQDLVQEVDTPELIDLGFLCEAKTYAQHMDLSNAKKRGDDYDVSDLYETNEVYVGVVENWQRLAPNTKTLLFSSNVSNSKQVCEQFNKQGFIARHIDGKTPKKEREAVLEWFDKTPDAIVCNCGILNAGFDQPDIETIILYRATTSLPLFLQMCGRGSRLAPNKTHFNILDFGNNVNRLGFWQEPREWSLSNDKKRSTKETLQPLKDCPKCFASLSLNTKVCPHCGHEFKKTKEQVFAELELLDYVDLKKLIKNANFEELEMIAEAKGYKKGWVYYQLKTLKELQDYAKYKGYNPKWAHYQINKRLDD